MKNRFKKLSIKVSKLFLAFLMIFTCINLNGINVKAVSFSPEAKANVDTLAEGINVPHLGETSNLYTIDIGGSDAFCLAHSKKMSSRYYVAKTSQQVSSDIKQVLNWYQGEKDNSGYGKEFSYALAQATIWAIQKGIVNDYDKLANIYEYVLAYYSSSGAIGHGSVFVSHYYKGEGPFKGILEYPKTGTYYIWKDGASAQQPVVPIGTPRETIPNPIKRKLTAEKSFSTKDQVVLNINKKDVDTGNGLGGVKFDLYRDNKKETTVTTNNNGQASHTFETTYTKTATATEEYISNIGDFHTTINKNKLPSNIFQSKSSALASAEKKALAQAKAEVQKLLNEKHTYKAVETKTKEEYYLNPSNTTVSKDFASGDGSGTVSMSFTNKRQLGSVNITKLDKETNNPVDTAIYGLYAKTNIVHPDGHTGILYNANDLVGTFPATNGQGKSTLNNLYLGEYYVKEMKAPYGYQLNPTQYDVTLSYAGQNVSVTDTSATVDDTVQRAEISLIKKDKELSEGKDENIFDGNSDGSQGDATRVGATYGLYARESITHADGTTGVVQYNQNSGSINEIKLLKGSDLQVKNVKANAGTLLATAKTDKDGKIAFGHLYNGKYYIKEIEASEGYLVDPTEYDLDVRYTNQAEALVSKHSDVFEVVKKQAFEVYKFGHVPNHSGVVNPLENVEFTVKLESDVQRVGWDNAPTYDVLKTNKKGYAKSIELPYGTYRVRETKAGVDYDTAEDFFVTVKEDNRTPQEFKTIINEQFTALVKAVKLDKETGKTVKLPNTTFKIKALTDVYVDGKEFKAGSYIGYWNWNIFDGFYTDTWKTNKDGYVMIDEKLSAGEYQLEEIHAPHGYVLDTEPVKFKVTNQGMLETSQDGKTPIITVYKSDESVKGQITVEKRGEVLVGYQDGQFVYEERPLANAVFEIKAKEDILDPSNDGTVLYAKGTVVETITTDSNGQATSSKLPLGKYEVVEKTAPHGMIINPQSQTVELKYADETTPVVFKNTTVKNDRQKVDLSLVKHDKDTNTPLANAEFDLIANQDITNADGTIIVKKGTVLTHLKSNEQGQINVSLDLPLDVAFKFVETKAPEGYIIDTTPIEFSTTYAGQDTQKLVIEKTKSNQATKIEISKTDMTTSKELEGNTLTIFEKGHEGNIFETWVSGKEPHIIKNLSTGIRYVLKETSAVEGFYLAQDIEFELDAHGNLFIVNEEGQLVKADANKIVMENDLVKGKLEWNKTGEIFNQTVTGQTEYGKTEAPVWEKSNLLQSEITIYANEDITLGNGITYYKKDEKVQTLESDFDPVLSQELLVGQYYYVETKTPHGYVADTDKHYFEIKDNQSSELQIVKEELFNKRPTVKVEFNKTLEEHKYQGNKDAYKDVLFGIYAREDIYDYKGNVAIKNGTLIGTSGINEKGQLVNMPDLPNGVYFLKELQTNKDYVLDTNEYDFEIAYHGQDVSEYTIQINEGKLQNQLKRGNIEIIKKGSDDENKLLVGAKFNIATDEDMKNVIATITTNDEGIARLENIEVGQYYVQEIESPKGYLLDNTIHPVLVDENGKTISLTVMNEYALTDIQVNKVDDKTMKPIVSKDFEFTMYADKELTQVIDVVHANTEDGTATFKDVKPLQTVYIKETKAPMGYKLSDEVKTIVVDENLEGYGDVHSFVYMNSFYPTTSEIQTGDDTMIASLGLLSLAGLGGIALFSKRKREE